ncbi:stonin-2 isoform X1 [Osmerus eperlanus]|uniref:stonin-2 isoform X1 n=3 Tax=Osmerus eperlanus TaxID=29151 RepID=UPI002E110337
MATDTTGRVGTGRVGWVAFPDEGFRATAEQQITDMSSRPSSAPVDTSSSIEPVAPPPQQNAWVLFDEKPWLSPVPQKQVKGPRTSLCSLASFWSAVPSSESTWATQSELSSVSMGASSCDLPSLNAEDTPDGTSSRPQSRNSSIFADDEGIDMDSISWTSNNKQIHGPSETTFNHRLSTWVTFDDDEEQPHQQRPEMPSHIKLENTHHSPLQDGNSNHIGVPVRNQKQNHACELRLLGLTPDGSTTTVLDPLLKNSTPYNKKNPFLDEELTNLQPSPINPFSSYFDCKPDLGGTEEIRSTTDSKGTGLERSCSFSPFFKSHNFDAPQEPTLFFPSESEPAGGSRRGEGGQTLVFDRPSPDCLDLNPLKNLHISDPDDPGSPTLPDDLLEEEEEEEGRPEGTERGEQEIPYQPDHMNPREGWTMLLRIPEKKNIMSSRHWGPIYVRLSDEGVLQLFYERGLDKPFRTVTLNPNHEVSEHRLQSYEETSRVHTLSVDLVQYRERRRLQPKSSVAHQPIREQLVKLGTTCYQDYLSFRHAVVEVLRRLPSPAAARGSPGLTSPVGSGLSEEEIQVEVRDDFYGTVGEGDGRIREQLVITRVHVLAFLSGSPGCSLGLNDVQVKGKEVVSRHDIIPNSTTRWIRLRDWELNDEHADELNFLSSHAVTFTPPSCRRFELLRFRTAFAEKTLPFTLRTVATIRGAEITLQSWLLMSQGFSSNRDALNLIPCENVAVRYPIPEIWAKNFKREGVMGERSLKARFNKGASFGTASTSGSEPVMRVTLGTAKYEQAFKAVVWRISRLPDKNSAMGHPHTFFCRLELGSDREVPDTLQKHLEVEFDMPAASASKATVRSLSVGESTDVKKWVNYRSHYYYQVPIEQKRDITNGSPTQDQPGECAQQ